MSNSSLTSYYSVFITVLSTKAINYVLLSLQPSFDKVVPPSFLELGLAELVSIYGELSDLGRAPPVIDSADLQQNPEVVNCNYCLMIIYL